MPPRSRLSREEKGKDIADSPSPTRDVSAPCSPLDDFDLIHRDALRDTENMTLSQCPLVADTHRMIRDEDTDRVEVGSSDASGREDRGRDQGDIATGSERGDSDESDRSPTPLRQVRERVCFDQIDCRPTVYHPGGFFEELAPLPPGLLRDPRAQSWGNVFGSSASHHTVRMLLRASGGAGVTYIIPSTEQRPWSPPVDGHLDEREGREELTFTKAEPNGIFSVKIRSNYNVLTGHPNKTQDWQRAYFFMKSDEHAFEEPPGDDYRVLWIRQLVDWESRLPCVLGPHKSRLPLFTRKQQRFLDKAREMDGVPDLSALLKGKLQLLTKKSTTVDPKGPSDSGVDVTSEGGGAFREEASREGASREEGPIATDQGGMAETSASGPKKKKKKTKRTKVGAIDEVPPEESAPVNATLTDEVPPEESAPVDATSEGSKSKKKKDGRKRSRGGAEGQEAVLVGAASGGHPRKKTERSVEAEPRPSTYDANVADAAIVDAVGDACGTSGNLSEEKKKTYSREGGSGGEPARSEPEGSIAKRRRVEFPDRVEFSYNETTPLILNPLRCAELTRQIRGGTKEMPQLEDIYFKNEYIDAASSRARSDGSMNFLVEKYDSALKQTMIQLGASEKLAQARLKAIERVRDEHKKANEKASKEKEVLRVKFEELEGKLKSAGAAKKELARENTRLEQATATLEKEKAELLEERDAAVEKLIRERQRLRDSRGLEVTRERERVEAAMIEKANDCFGRVRDHLTRFGRVRDHLTRFDAFGKAKNLYGQASGTRKCLEMIKASGTEIPQEMIDVFIEQEKLYEAEATKLRVDPLSDSDLTLSLVVLPSRFVEGMFRLLTLWSWVQLYLPTIT
ncbi:hypothetical protein YC2023_008581 [Brassica napus]